MKYAPRKVYIKESGRYVELSYTDFCRRRESDQTYMDKLLDRKSTRLNSSHSDRSRMPSSA